MGLGCPRRNRINAPKISGQCWGSRLGNNALLPPLPPAPAGCLPALLPRPPFPGKSAERGRNKNPPLLNNMTPIFFPAYFLNF